MSLKERLWIWEEFEVLEPECKSAQRVSLVIFVSSSPVLVPPVAFLSNILLADGASKPFHHTPHECKHFAPCFREKAYWEVQLGVAPVLVKKDEEFENSGTGVAWEKER